MRSTAVTLKKQRSPSGYAREPLRVCIPQTASTHARGRQIIARLALVRGEWSDSRPGRFTPGERAPGTHWIVSWVGLRTGLDVEKRKFLTLLGLEPRYLGRPARSLVAISTELSRLPYTLQATQNFQLFSFKFSSVGKPKMDLVCRLEVIIRRLKSASGSNSEADWTLQESTCSCHGGSCSWPEPWDYVKLYLSLPNNHNKKAYRGVEVQLHDF
jgi:hypothetical protein